MGVHGLWKLLEPAGKPVPVETLENKVLAVDVSIWLHQAARGFQDARGQALPNAHLLGLFHRLCKLLFWRVRPVFVFDGGAPLLKQQTVAARRRRREDAQERADRARRRLVELHLKKYAVLAALKAREGDAGPSRTLPLPPLLLPSSSQAPADEMFVLPPTPRRDSNRSEDEDAPSSDDDRMSTVSTSTTSTTAPRKVRALRTRWGAELDLHSVDVRSAQFQALPADVRHEVLTELKETRKQSSWGRLHEMPRESGDFSSYQMKRLLQRRSVQESLESVEKEMGGRSMSLAELEELMTETGALTAAAAAAAVPGRRIAADASTRYILLTGGGSTSGVTISEEKASKTEEITSEEKASKTEDITSEEKASKTEEITSDSSLSVLEQESTSAVDDASSSKPVDVANEYFEDYYSDEEVTEWLPEFDYVQSSKDDSDDFVSKQLKAAHDFIFENSGLTQEQIFAVIKDHSSINKPSALDQPSTSKAGSSKSLEVSSSKVKSDSFFDDKTGIPSTSSSSVLDIPPVSDGVGSCRSEKEIDLISIPNKEGCLTSGHSSSSISKTSELVSDLRVNKAIIETGKENVDINMKKEKAYIKEELIRKFQHPIDISAGNTDKFSGGIERSKDGISHLSSISYSAHISPTIHKKKSIKKVNKHSAVNNSQVSDDSSDLVSHFLQLEKCVRKQDSCSSDEDFVEVAESNPPAISNTLKPTQAKVAPLEVVIQTGMSDLDEDIFADVFVTGSEQSEKVKKNTIPSFQSDNIITKLTSSSLDSKITSEKTVIMQNSMQQKEHPPEKITNIEKKEITMLISPVSNTDDVMVMSDSSSEDTEVIARVTEVSEENDDHVPKKDPVKLSTEQLEELQGSLQEEGNLLLRAQAREERLAASITDQMVQEAQELLQLFGVPYLVAPMEAEAQCAFLDHTSLTDGTITDDSDIWLFGGQKVYKNFFDQKKHVLQFRDIDILHSFKLTRSQLVLLALLVGSDYTTGLPGVGPVTALEILAAFPTKSKQGPPSELVEGLCKFREWLTSGMVGRWDKAKLRNKLKDLELSREFPSVSVVEAYLSPKVDESMEKFSWGVPDVESIKEFARIKFGWPTSKTHEILQPIMKKINIKITQLSIESYFQPKPKLPPGGGSLSKRIQEAIDKIGASEGSGSDDDPPPVKKSKTQNSALQDIKRTVQTISTRLNKTKGSSSRPSRGRGRGNTVDSQTDEGIPLSIASCSTANTDATNMNIPNTSTKKSIASGPFAPNSGKEFILQKEKDKLNMLKNKLKAIEVFRKSARGLDKTKRDRKKKRTILKETHLSESSDSSG